MRRFAFGMVCALLLAACQPPQDNRELPTVAVLPSETPTDVPTDTPAPTDTPTLTLAPTDTLVPSATFTPTITRTPTPPPSPTPTNTPTDTPTLTNTPRVTPTSNPTQGAIASATAKILEAPTIATFTPIPPGSDAMVRPTSTGTPIVAAGVVITEAQFQEQLNLVLRDIPDVQNAVVEFAPGGMFIELTASGGEALVTGRVFIRFTVVTGEQGLNNFLSLQPPLTLDEFVMNGGGVAPERFVQIVYTDVTPAVVTALDAILNQRLGEERHNLENVIFDESAMTVSLLVPLP